MFEEPAKSLNQFNIKRIMVARVLPMAIALVFVGCQLDPVTGPEQQTEPTGPGQQPEQQTVVAAIEKVVEIQEGVAVSLFSATDPDSPLDERLRAVAQKLTVLPTVTDAVAGADTIRVSYASGLEGGLLLLPEGSTRRGPTGRQLSIHGYRDLMEGSGDFLPATDATPPPVVANHKVLICAPLDNNLFEPQYAETGAAVADTFNRAKGRYFVTSEGPVRAPGFDVKYLDYTQCTLEELQQMSNYGTIVFSGHGMWGSHLLLGYRVDSRKFASLFDEYLWNVTVNVVNRAGIVTGTRTVTAITDHFVRGYSRSNPAGMDKARIVYAAACTSTQRRSALNDTDLVGAFTNNGSEGFYLGFDNTVSDRHADVTTRQFFASMVRPGGKSEASYVSIPNLIDPFFQLTPPLPPSLGIPPPATLTRHAGRGLHALRYSTPPSFGEPGTSTRAVISHQSYEMNRAITPLTLPLAVGFDGDLTYRLEPTVPGLTFDPVARTLSGTPTEEGTYHMTYEVVDADADKSVEDRDGLTFTIIINTGGSWGAVGFREATIANEKYGFFSAVNFFPDYVHSHGSGLTRYVNPECAEPRNHGDRCIWVPFSSRLSGLSNEQLSSRTYFRHGIYFGRGKCGAWAMRDPTYTAYFGSGDSIGEAQDDALRVCEERSTDAEDPCEVGISACNDL